MVNFDIEDLRASDEDELEILGKDGQPTGWKWRMAGPGHPRTIEQGNRVARERLRREEEQERARVNGRKWKGDSQSPDEVIDGHVRFVMERLLGWSEVTIGGKPFPFSEENARTILRDHSLKPSPLVQALEFLGDEASFSGRSAKTSDATPSASSNSTGTKKAEHDATA